MIEWVPVKTIYKVLHWTNDMVAPGANLPDIRGLSFEDRRLLLERLWDSLVEEGQPIPLTPEQELELDRRLEDHSKILMPSSRGMN